MMFTALFFIFFLLVVGSIGNILCGYRSVQTGTTTRKQKFIFKGSSVRCAMPCWQRCHACPWLRSRRTQDFILFLQMFRRPVNPSNCPTVSAPDLNLTKPTRRGTQLRHPIHHFHSCTCSVGACGVRACYRNTGRPRVLVRAP